MVLMLLWYVKMKWHIEKNEKYITKKKMLNIDLKALRDKSLLLRNEAQALRTNSLLLRNELKELRAASHDIKTKLYILRTESQMLRAKSKTSQLLEINHYY